MHLPDAVSPLTCTCASAASELNIPTSYSHMFTSICRELFKF